MLTANESELHPWRHIALLSLFGLSVMGQSCRQCADDNPPDRHVKSVEGKGKVIAAVTRTVEGHILTLSTTRISGPMDDISFLSGRIDNLEVTTPSGQTVEVGSQVFTPTLDGGAVAIPLIAVPETVSRLRLSGTFIVPSPNYRYPIPEQVDIPLPQKNDQDITE